MEDRGNRFCSNDEKSWRELMGKDILFRIISSGDRNESSQQAEAGDFVHISYEGYLRNAINKGFFIRQENTVVVLGDGDVLPGLEMGVRFCPVGCTSEVKFDSKFGYGSWGRRGSDGFIPVPPSTDLYFKFTVHEIISVIDDVELALMKKRIGNESFKYDLDNGEKALNVYNKAISLLDAEIDSHKKILVDLHNNVVLVHYKKKAFSLSKSSCLKIIEELDSRNVKAWIRLGYIYLDSDYEKANHAVGQAAKFAPNQMDNIDVRKLYSLLKKKKIEYKQKEKEMSLKMFDSLTNKNETKFQKRRWSLLFGEFLTVALISILIYFFMSKHNLE